MATYKPFWNFLNVFSIFLNRKEHGIKASRNPLLDETLSSERSGHREFGRMISSTLPDEASITSLPGLLYLLLPFDMRSGEGTYLLQVGWSPTFKSMA